MFSIYVPNPMERSFNARSWGWEILYRVEIPLNTSRCSGSDHCFRSFNDTILSPSFSYERTDIFVSWTKIITISTNAAQARDCDPSLFSKIRTTCANEVNRGVFCTPSEFFRVSPRCHNISDFHVTGYALGSSCGSGTLFFTCRPNPCLGAVHGIRTRTFSLEG